MYSLFVSHMTSLHNKNSKVMENKSSSKCKRPKVIQWIARIVSLLIILLTLTFAIGEALTEHCTITESLPFVNIFMGILILGGPSLAVKWKLIAGSVSLFGFIEVALVTPNALSQPGKRFFALPAVHFLLSLWRSMSVNLLKKTPGQIEREYDTVYTCRI